MTEFLMAEVRVGRQAAVQKVAERRKEKAPKPKKQPVQKERTDQ